MTKAIYCIASISGDNEDCYWVQAGSTDEARSMVTASADIDANNTSAWRCWIDATKCPPYGVIYRRLSGPISVK